jgi:outer membrane receptor protein involved in Fe transport
MIRLPAAILVLALLSLSPAFADDDDGKQTPPSPGTVATPMAASGDLEEVVVNGVRRGDLILPTTVTSTSAYGLDLNVMDTPRNNTLLSKAQLDALNVQNPGGFSYLTSSSYTDASFGEPNIPRIRGQYADVFFNGMRDSFTSEGYGAPMSFNSVDSIDIVKGPASVQGGAGAGVGGAINIVTKMPSFTRFSEDFNVEVDSEQKRRLSADIGGPINSDIAARVSVTEDDSGSYYNDMYFHQQAVFASVIDQISPRFSVLVTGGIENTTYRENDGVNRVNQALIDNGTYLTGGVIGGWEGGTNPNISGFGTTIDLTGSTQLNDRIIIDEPDGTGAHSLHGKAQIIGTFNATDNFSIVNNTFYDYMNRYNQTDDYYADTAMGSFTIENKTDFKVKFASGAVNHDIDAGLTYRYAHVDDIQNFLNEPVSIFDLSTSPSNWIFPADLQTPSGAILYNAAFGHPQWGLPGRFQGPPGPDGYALPGLLNGTVDSNLQDAAIFLEHQMKFSPEWSVLYGLRGDLVQLNYSDPLGGPDYGAPPGLTPLPQSASTGWYGLYNGNVSVVFRPSERVSSYLTYNKAQYVLPTANDGAVATWGEDPSLQLRQNTLLEELGVKFDLLDKALFLSSAVFYQERTINTGVGGLAHSPAHIKGAEIELNYQPDPHFFATASYSYLHTTLDSPSGFYNFPAQPGINYDGAGTDVVWESNQTFRDPGVPEHLFNVLLNYKHKSGWGVQMNIQVTGPVETTQSGYINVAATAAGYPGLPPSIVSMLTTTGGYYQSPTIPWQYTVNAAAFYSFRAYQVKFTIYNLTDRSNLLNDLPEFGNDFLTRLPPRDFDLSVSAKF